VRLSWGRGPPNDQMLTITNGSGDNGAPRLIRVFGGLRPKASSMVRRLC
jgi:hypothetical protein